MKGGELAEVNNFGFNKLRSRTISSLRYVSDCYATSASYKRHADGKLKMLSS